MKLPAQVQVALQNREMDQGHARALLGLSQPSLQLKVYNEIRDKGYSVRQVEDIVKSINDAEEYKGTAKASKKQGGHRSFEEYNLLKNKLSDFFQTKVQMTCSAQGKGKITIPFSNDEELERIISLFDKMKG